MSATHDLVINQGATFRYKFFIKQQDMTPVDITGSVVRMQIRPNHQSDEVLLDLGVAEYIFVSDATLGEVSIEVPASVTKDLNFIAAYYDIELEYTETGYVYRFIGGKVRLSPEITR